MGLHVRLFVSKAGNLRFTSRIGQMGYRVANESPPLQHFLKRAVLRGHNEAEMGHWTRQLYTHFGTIQHI